MPEEELFSSHKEADSRIILHCDHIARNFPAMFVIAVRSPDTDVLVLLMKFSKNIDQTILFDTGTGNKRRLLNVKDIESAKGQTSVKCFQPYIFSRAAILQAPS